MKIVDVPQSGHLGTYISIKTRHGESRRRYVVPRDPRTADQLRVRARFGQPSSRWRALSDSQRAAWIVDAEKTPSHGRLGRPGTLTGIQLFVRINANLADLGLPPVTDPPPRPEFRANPVEELTITNTSRGTALKLKVSGAVAQYTLVFGTAPCSPGVTFPPRFKFLGLLPCPAFGWSDITALYVAKFGVPPGDRRVFIQTVQQIDGWKDLPKRTTAVVPGS